MKVRENKMSDYILRVYTDSMQEIECVELPTKEELKIMLKLFGANKIILLNNKKAGVICQVTK